MKRIVSLLIILHSSLFTLHSQTVSAVFRSMPDSIFTLLTERNRHDMVDFYNNHMEAKVRNRLNEYARLDTLTDNYLHLTLSKVSTATMKLLEATDSTTIICLVQTVDGPVADSRVHFYDSEWHRLSWLSLPSTPTDRFFTVSSDETPEDEALTDDPRPTLGQVQRSIDDLRLIEVTVAPEVPVFTMTLSLEPLSREEKKLAQRYVKSVRYRWTGHDFVPEP